jgi:hypothetical protein
MFFEVCSGSPFGFCFWVVCIFTNEDGTKNQFRHPNNFYNKQEAEQFANQASFCFSTSEEIKTHWIPCESV